MKPRVLLIILFTLFLALGYAQAQDSGGAQPVQRMVGENHLYFMDFLFFSKLAEGELRLLETDQPDVYRAELIGRTLGIASWIAGNRTQTYTSLMELAEDGSLHSIEHSANVDKRRWRKWRNRSRLHRYDYQQGRVIEEKFKEGVRTLKEEHVIPEGQHPVDMLTAFYNLRAGVYGPLVRGTQFLIPTYSSKGFVDIEVNVLTVKQQAEQGAFPPHGLLLSAVIDPEIFETDSGGLYFWFDGKGVPARGVVEDVIGLGDVRGYLKEGGQ
jgi:hypothetical protein